MELHCFGPVLRIYQVILIMEAEAEDTLAEAEAEDTMAEEVRDTMAEEAWVNTTVIQLTKQFNDVTPMLRLIFELN